MYRLRIVLISLFAGFVAILAIPSYEIAFADDAVTSLPDCNEAPARVHKPKTVRKGATYMIVVTGLEDQGKGNLRPEYDAPTSECVFEKFATETGDAVSIYTPFEKGMQTILYRFVLPVDPEQREVLVLYNGMAGFLQGGQIFYVAEFRNGRISYYAMYDGQPRYKDVKQLAKQIFEDKAETMIAAEWPDDADELVITAYNSKRLK